jgi:hypothetical protein
MKAILIADETGSPREPFIDFNSNMIDMRDDGTIFEGFQMRTGVFVITHSTPIEVLFGLW